MKQSKTAGISFFEKNLTLDEVFLGSVSHNVARHSVAPVLLIPPPGKR